MNTNKLKKFASKSRELLINEVAKNISYLEVRDLNKLPSYYQNWVQIDDVSFKEWKKLEQRKNLIARVADIWEEQVIEEIAYLWFNRFIALRYMEVNNYLSYWSRVVSSDDKNKLEPDLIKNATHLIDLDLDNEIIYKHLDDSDNDKLYKYLILNICNSLHSELPFMFEKISDYSELLFPESLLERWSFLDLLINEVDETDFKEVEILGWFYQYYISDKKDIVFDELKKKKKKIWKESIPAATQLFTPKWIVKYMVQNSVGKTWLESHPNTELQSKWDYYIESESTTEVNPNLKPEDITVLDPAMGSWHILVYAFEILFDIYKSAWYTDDEIPKLIIENNLYWLEIDDRAWQIACFAIMMKARKYDKKILKLWLEPSVCSIQESSECDKIDELIYPELAKLCIAFKQWKLLWSLITLNDFDLEKVNKEFEKLQNENSIFNVNLVKKLPLIIKQAEFIYRKYSCVVSNPPYMGSGWMDKDLWIYLKKNYPDTKSDLMTCFVERNLKFTDNSWYTSMIILPSWLFLTSFEKLRINILENFSFNSLLHMGRWIFWVDWGSVAFTIKKEFNPDSVWAYFRLHKRNFQHIYFEDIEKLFLNAKNNHDYKYDFDEYRWEWWVTEIIEDSSEDWLQIYYTQKQINFSSIPWSPIAYWVWEKIKNIFEKEKALDHYWEWKQWMTTSNNDLFRRNWQEINHNESAINWNLSKKWYPYNSGWDYRKWYGNQNYVLNWYNNWEDIKNIKKSVIRNERFYLKKSISWSKVSSSSLAFRYYQDNFLFDVAGCSIFIKEEYINEDIYILWLWNSNVIRKIVSYISPTINYEVWQISSLPIVFPKSQDIKNKINNLTQQNIDISKEEWDSRETSWDFSQNELLKHKSDNSLENSYNNYCEYWNDKFFTQHKNEEELNRLFIEIYGLEDEITSEVELNDITLLKTETKIEEWNLVFQKEEIVKQFISYAVGCMMWRYSLNNEWLVFAGWEFDSSKYSSFEADDDGIIPVLSDEYFDDDIVARFKEFVKVAFGEDKINQNLDFIANGLTKRSSETSLVRIRRYFANEFYADHVKRYKKRPIYWMFTSWKDKTFNALVYLHRYEKWIISTLRMEYLIKLQWKLEWQRRQIESNLVSAEWKTKLDYEKDKNDIIKKIDILKHYDEKLKHLAEQKIELDLDDGVKVNYPKLWELLEAIKL